MISRSSLATRFTGMFWAPFRGFRQLCNDPDGPIYQAYAWMDSISRFLNRRISPEDAYRSLASFNWRPPNWLPLI